MQAEVLAYLPQIVLLPQKHMRDAFERILAAGLIIAMRWTRVQRVSILWFCLYYSALELVIIIIPINIIINTTIIIFLITITP